MKAFLNYIKQIERIKALIDKFNVENVTCKLRIQNVDGIYVLKPEWKAPYPDKLRRKSELAAVEYILSGKDPDVEEFDDTLTKDELNFLNKWKRETVWDNYERRFDKKEDCLLNISELTEEHLEALRNSLSGYLVK